MDKPNEPIHGLSLLAGASILAEPLESRRSPPPLPELMSITLDLATPDACDSTSTREREREGEGWILLDPREEREDGTYLFRAGSMLLRPARARPSLPWLGRAWLPLHTPARRLASLLLGCHMPASLPPRARALLPMGLGEREGRGGRGATAVRRGL